jgi:hypothetical protein
MTNLLHRIGWLFAALLSCSAGQAQDVAATQWLKEINRDIWMRLLEGVAKNDASLYVNVHSDDYIRVQEEGRLILDHESYVDDTKKMMQRYAERGTSLTMQVRFEERISNGRYSPERGISRVVFASKSGEPRIFYGRFHTVSRKESGRWKIVTDFSPASEEVLSEHNFARAHAMDDVWPFRCYMPYPAKRLDCGETGDQQNSIGLAPGTD